MSDPKKPGAGIRARRGYTFRLAADVTDMIDALRVEWAGAAMHDITRSNVVEACIRSAYRERETIDLGADLGQAQDARKAV